MRDHINNILKELDEGSIDTKKAIKKIESINTSPSKKVKKASRIKITIIDKTEGKNIRIPSIPFWLINSLISLGLGLGSIAARFVDNMDEETKKILEIVDSKDLKNIINELKNHGPFDMVDIEESDNTTVQIKVL